jgi:hypothetical protein
MAEWGTLSNSSVEVKNLWKKIHCLNKLNTATGLQNMGCHRDIIKQRTLDFGKTVAGCS